MKKNKIFIIIILLLFSLRCFPCSCETINPYMIVNDFNASEIIFKGKVSKITLKEIDGQPFKEIIFTINSDYKKNNFKTITIYTPTEGTACGLEIDKINDEWIIWAYSYNGRNFTNQCTRSKLVKKYSTVDLNLLEQLSNSSGYNTWKNPDDTILGEGTIVNTKAVGHWNYYDNGFIVSEGTYKEGLKTGDWTEYYLPSELVYNNNKTDLSLIYNSPTWKNFRKTKTKTAYVNGKKEGTSTLYSYQGEVVLIFEYLAGKRNGISTHYSNNKPDRIDTYKNDELNGASLIFHSNGIIQLLAYYKDGVPVGNWQLFNENGEIVCVVNHTKIVYDDSINKFKCIN